VRRRGRGVRKGFSKKDEKKEEEQEEKEVWRGNGFCLL